MTKRITSAALRFINEAFGLTGAGEQTTSLDDGNVSQVLEIQRMAAYSQAVGSSQGFVMSILANTHAAAGTTVETMDPYNPGTRVDSFNQVEIADFDMWYFGSLLQRVSTTQTIDQAQVLILGDSFNLINEGDLSSVETPLVTFTGTETVTTGAGVFLVELGSSQTFVKSTWPFLWPRGQEMRVRSATSGAGATSLRFGTLWCMVNRGLKPGVF